MICGLMLLVGGARAWASGYGYVCYSELYSAALQPSYGPGGSIFVGIYSGPKCTGSWVGGGILCSTGENDSNCFMPYSESAINTLASLLVKAASVNQRVYINDNNGHPLYAEGY
jgi:hypothetical protein